MENSCGNPYTNQIFQEAVERSDFAIVKTLLKYGVYLRRNQRNRNRLTALQQSVLDGNGRMAILLLENGADIEAKTSNGWTCLHIAAALGDLDILTTLINHCACLLAITKNEELPIDLAATREIIIKLAKEMSRVGYSELAQWYMKKLAAREGVFYVLSANTLLDLACDDNYDKSYSNGPPCYVRQDDDQNEVFVHEQGKQGSYWPLQDPQALQFNPDPQADLWMEQPPNENPTYLSYSSGYISEVVFDPNSGEYSKVRRSVSMSSGSSPRLKYPELVVSESKSSLSTVITPEEEDKIDGVRYGSLARSGTSRRHSHASKGAERSNTIELLIDYSHFEDCDDPEEEAEDIAALENNISNIKPPPAIIDEVEENTNLGSQDDNLISNDMSQNTQCDTTNVPDNQFKSSLPESTKSIENQYKTQLCESYHGPPTSKTTDNQPLSQYEGDIFDGYHGTPMTTSMSSVSNDNQYKTDINDGFQQNVSSSISSNRTSDNPYKPESTRTADNPYKGEPSRTTDNLYKSESSRSSDNPYKSDSSRINDNQYKNEPSRTTDNQYKPEPSRASDIQYKSEPSRTTDIQYKSEPSRTTDIQYKSEPSRTTDTQYKNEPSRATDNQYKNEHSRTTDSQYKSEPSRTTDNQYKPDTSRATDSQYKSEPSRTIDNQYKSESSDSYNSSPFSSLLSSTIESQEQLNASNPRYRRFETPDVSNNYDMKNRNVRFDNSDAANEFCNCPNCKKLGYAFSPDIRSTGRRVMHFGGEQVVLSPNQVMMSDLQLQRTLEMMQGKGYPNSRVYHDEAGDRSLCYTQGHPHKPRKRKKKLFSGIRSIFKDSIKVQRGGMENSPVVDDAGILFAFSLRDRSKSKEIKNRYDVRRSNSFSGCTSPHGGPEMVNTYTHDQVVPPPMKFSDTYGDGDPRKKNFYLENSSHGTNSAEASVMNEDGSGPFKQFYSDNTDVQSQMSDMCDENNHLGNHIGPFSSPLYDSQSVIEEHTCEYHTCECDSQSIPTKETNINNMMSKINVNDNEIEKLDESKFVMADGKKCSKTKESYAGKSL